MIKNLLRYLAQQLLGFDRYLVLFSRLGKWRMRLPGYEKEFRFFLTLLPDEGAILDIGANIGVTTSALAIRCPNAVIYAFEPIPANNRVLAKTIAHDKLQNITVFPVALGNRNGNVEMVMPEWGKTKMHGLSHIVHVTGSNVKGERLSVPIHRLDDMADVNALQKINAVKLDVENAEWDVLQGAEKLICKHKPVIFCELWNDEKRVQCIHFLEALGYTVKLYRAGELVEFKGQPAINFFFLPV